MTTDVNVISLNCNWSKRIEMKIKQEQMLFLTFARFTSFSVNSLVRIKLFLKIFAKYSKKIKSPTIFEHFWTFNRKKIKNEILKYSPFIHKLSCWMFKKYFLFTRFLLKWPRKSQKYRNYPKFSSNILGIFFKKNVVRKMIESFDESQVAKCDLI